MFRFQIERGPNPPAVRVHSGRRGPAADQLRGRPPQHTEVRLPHEPDARRARSAARPARRGPRDRVRGDRGPGHTEW